jgi:hypothetical protein
MRRGRNSPMISAWWLLLIVPVSVYIGIAFIAVMIVGSRGERWKD